MLILTKELKQEMRLYAQEFKPKEVCGLLVNQNDKVIFYKCSNKSFHPDINCILDPFDYIRASELGEIIGHFHSHEPNFCSLIDNLNAINHNIHCIVYSWKYDRFFAIEPKLKSYLNVSFNYGDNDCLGLVRNYYKNELSITINDYNRNKDWSKLNPNIFLDNFEKEGFYKVELDDIKLHDIVIFNINKKPSHLGIYLNDNFILHHPYNSESIISELNEPLQKRINCIIRHKDIKYE